LSSLFNAFLFSLTWFFFLPFILNSIPYHAPSSSESRVFSPYPIVHWSASSTPGVVITEHAELHGI
jgi:hypothetical protein